MFNFTSTTFIHKPEMIEANPDANNTTGTPSSNVLRLDNKLFKYDDVVAIYRNPYVAPANAKLKVDVEGFMTSIAGTTEYQDAKKFRLDFYVKRSGDVNAYYSNDYVFKGKDFHYEWTNKHNTAAKVAKLIKGINKLYGDIYFKVYTENDTDAGHDVLVFENDNYGVFIEAELKVYLPDASDCCTFREGGWDTVDALPKNIHGVCATEDVCTVPAIPYKTSEDNEDYYQAAVPASGNDAGTPQLGGWLISYYGVNGTGTYEQLLKDLRLPTLENMRWMSPTAQEMPIPGAKYTQYTIHQISCRGILGGSAVGEVTHSKTTHVFFVPTCGCEDSLDNLLKQTIMDMGWGKKLLSVDKALEGEAADTNAVLKDDPTHNPASIEKFEHDLTIKAITTNIPAAENEEGSAGNDEGLAAGEP